MSNAEQLERDALNQVCIQGHTNRTLEAIMSTREPDAVMAYLTQFAGECIRIAVAALSTKPAEPTAKAQGNGLSVPLTLLTKADEPNAIRRALNNAYWVIEDRSDTDEHVQDAIANCVLHDILRALNADQPAEPVGAEPAAAYRKRNPLGGPAVIFEACANAIRAGDPVAFAMANFGLAWAAAAPSAEPMPLSLIRRWPEGFEARLQHVWLDVVSFIPNVKLYDLQRVLTEFGFRMEVYEDAAIAASTKENPTK